MTTATYMDGRSKYNRPQAILWANNPGIQSENQAGDFIYVPDGSEYSDFIILSDHNRSPIDVKPQRIEKRERMINGRMRSYHVADKLTISTSWQMLPSRAFALPPEFDSSGTTDLLYTQQNTADLGAGGNDILSWYENYTGSFWVYLSYDNVLDTTAVESYNKLNEYGQIMEMFISDFSYSVEKRSIGYGDLWNISVTLEEA